jgi:histidine ammonia-lyase
VTDASPLRLDGTGLTVEGVVAVAREDRPVAVTEAARQAVRAGRERVESVLDAGDAVYGLNTGFGDLVDTRIPSDEVDDLQTNLLRSHAAGSGRDLSRAEVRALLVVRLNTLLRGYSGVREIVVDHLLTLLNRGVHPVVRSRGSLGASGDLAPLAHLSLVLLGEGVADVDSDGDADEDGDADTERVSGAEALRRAGLDPLTLRAKEGLALINGTQLTTGLAALALFDAERLVRAADAAGALTTEVTMGSTAACDPAIHDLRPHRGQAASARNVKRLTRESEIVESHRNCDRVQDAYSIRCLPQVHGAVRDAVSHLHEAVETELNAVTDNPIVFPRDVLDARASGTDTAAVVSGGNFHGAPLAHRLDYVTAALADLASIAERRIDRTLNPSIQESHLPPFLTPDSGVRSGYMIPQYTAAALVNECRAEGRPATDSTPVSGGQEDHVSMSATSALATRRTLDRARRVVAIELLCAAQAAEFVDDLRHGVGTGVVYDAVRAVVDPLEEDRPSDGDVDALAALVREGKLDTALFDAVDELE